jgi:hypothetical protein
MADDPRAIDVSVLADLVRIRNDEELLAERLAKMEATKDKVSSVVYKRVRGDYEARKGALEAQAKAPREKAGKEYAKLRVLIGQAEKELEEARLDNEELEFRHSLGEFPEEEYASKVGALRDRLGAKQGELDGLARTKADFLGAFGSEEELERAASGAPAPAPPAERARGATIPAAVPVPKVGPSEITVAGDYGPPPTAPAPPVPASSKAAPAPTQPLVAPPPPPPAGASPQPPPPPPVTPPPPPGGFSATQTSPTAPTAVGGPALAEHGGATMVMALPRVAILYEDKPEEEFVLKREPTHIGRLPRNSIQLPFPDVSREHATIVPEGSRYKILDRGSENGIYVNGERVNEHLLSDGDIIQIGRRRLVYRS